MRLKSFACVERCARHAWSQLFLAASIAAHCTLGNIRLSDETLFGQVFIITQATMCCCLTDAQAADNWEELDKSEEEAAPEPAAEAKEAGKPAAAAKAEEESEGEEEESEEESEDGSSDEDSEEGSSDEDSSEEESDSEDSSSYEEDSEDERERRIDEARVSRGVEGKLHVCADNGQGSMDLGYHQLGNRRGFGLGRE